MENRYVSASTIDEYIAKSAPEIQPVLHDLRALIKSLVPDCGEKIAYGIPTFTLQGNLVHFAGYKSHIGFYPGSSGIEKFKDELSKYHLSKGTVQFPLGEPIPTELIKRIVFFRVEENLAKVKNKKKPASA